MLGTKNTKDKVCAMSVTGHMKISIKDNQKIIGWKQIESRLWENAQKNNNSQCPSFKV